MTEGSVPALPPLTSSAPDNAMLPLSQTHPPPSSTSSAADVLQRSFDLFTTLDAERRHVIGIEQLKEALRLFSASDDRNSVPVVSGDDARAIMDIVAGQQAAELSFSQFHAVYAAVNILHQLSKEDLPHLRMKDVRRALISAGIVPTQEQLDSMMILSDSVATYDRSKINIADFLRIYDSTRHNATHTFLHSWFYAGRNSTAMRKPVQLSPFQDFLAGTAAGVSLTLVGHPFDTIKVRLQTQTGFKGGWDCLVRTVRGEGVLSLFKGMSGPLCTIPLVNAIVFYSYATAKNFMHKLQTEKKPLTLWQITMAGSFAGLVNCVVICPVELIKTRLQVQFEPHMIQSPIHISAFRGHAASAAASSAPALRPRAALSSSSASAGLASRSLPRPLPLLYPMSPQAPAAVFNGPLDCISRTIASNGVTGLFRGLTATVYREVPAYGGQFFCYEALKRFLTPAGEKSSDVHPARLLLAGGAAGTFGWILSYPMDFIKSQLQSEPYGQPSPWRKNRWLLDGGFFDCWQRTVSQHGWRALWRGFGPCLARAFPANAAGFVTYELSLKFLRKYDMT